MGLSDDARINRDSWDSFADEYQERHAPQLNRDDFVWGVWSIPESKLGILGDLRGKKVLELGCGAAQLSLAVHLAGGDAVGIDNSPKQLAHARSNLANRGIEFPLFLSSAEELPFPDFEFDTIFCDHGAMSFSPTETTLKEVFRVLKTGGVFAFNIQSPFHEMGFNPQTGRVEERLHGDYFALGRHTDDGGAVYFQHGFGTWIRLFRDAGFTVDSLTELRPPEGASSTYDFVPYEWSRRYPAENIWKLSKPIS
jgi:ubiquinone/menaquinone biosynthesis C-methylase UbiE